MLNKKGFAVFDTGKLFLFESAFIQTILLLLNAKNKKVKPLRFFIPVPEPKPFFVFYKLPNQIS